MGERGDADEQGGVDGPPRGERGRARVLSRLRRSVVATLPRVTTEESWAPPPAAEPKLVAIRRHLEREEGMHVVETVSRVREDGGPAVVGVTDDRLVVVTDASIRDVDLTRVTSVRATIGTTLGVRLRDARVIGAVGYLCSIVAFLAVMAVARNPLSPAVTMLAMGGALWFTHVRPHGLLVGGRTVTEHFERFRPVATLTAALRRVERRFAGEAGPDPLTRWVAGGFVLVPFAATVGLEGVSLAPLFVTLTVGSFACVGYAIRHGDEFEALALVRRRYARVDVAVEQEQSLSIRTRPDSSLRQALRTRTAVPSPVSSDPAVD